MIVSSKFFNQLNLEELYELLRLRSEVFVVEQKCIYQDIDNKDQKALHVLGFENEELVAYTRVYKSGDYLETATIGRVLVKNSARSKGYGYDIMRATINAIEEKFETESVCLSAQTYLKTFYNNLGFKETGEEYLEDGIPHILMIKD
ncbi:MAG: GNAT family N-acetyltransferase [Flavobacteriaceae bacterium]|nr:GNAT family N-acetyltransferase [Flavobacteriaceae bacterium]